MRRLARVAMIVGLAPWLSSCVVWGPEHVCSEGEFPVYATSNSTGGACVKNGKEPPSGYARYPAGRVPEIVGDKYDRWPLGENYPWPDEVDPPAKPK